MLGGGGTIAQWATEGAERGGRSDRSPTARRVGAMSGRHDRAGGTAAVGIVLATGPIVVRGLGRGVKRTFAPGRPSRHRAVRDDDRQVDGRLPAPRPAAPAEDQHSLTPTSAAEQDDSSCSPAAGAVARAWSGPRVHVAAAQVLAGRTSTVTETVPTRAGTMLGAATSDPDLGDAAVGEVLPDVLPEFVAADWFFDDLQPIGSTASLPVGPSREEEGGLASTGDQGAEAAAPRGERPRESGAVAPVPRLQVVRRGRPAAVVARSGKASRGRAAARPVPGTPGRWRSRRARTGRRSIGRAGVVVVLALMCAGLLTAVASKTREDAALAAQSAAHSSRLLQDLPKRPGASGPLVAVVGDETVDRSADGDGAARWTDLLGVALGTRVVSVAEAGAGFAAESGAGGTFDDAVARIPTDAVVVVLVGSTHDAGASATALAHAASTAVGRARERAPMADVVMLGPLVRGTASTNELLQSRDVLQEVADITDSGWLDPMAGRWANADAPRVANDLTDVDEQRIVDAARPALARVLRRDRRSEGGSASGSPAQGARAARAAPEP